MRTHGLLKLRGEAYPARFTLVEMLVAVALGAIILAVSVTAFTQGATVSTVAHAKTQGMHNARVALEFLEEDLTSASLQPTGALFIGLNSTAAIDGIDNDGNDGVDEDGNQVGAPDPIDFLDTSGKERHGIEFLTVDKHVVYYLTREAETQRGFERGILVRAYDDRASDEGTWLGQTWGRDYSENRYYVGMGITRFAVRYFYEGEWCESWDSTDPTATTPGGQSQYRRLPELVEITLRVVDEEGVLDQEANNPLLVRRVIELPDAP